jgi:limonene-1,2-epoxide hydrolase
MDMNAMMSSSGVGGMPVKKNPRELVLAYLQALNDENFDLARRYVSDEMEFTGALASRQGADAVFADLERMRLKYDIKKVFVDANDVCVFYDVTLSGVTVFTCGWYKVEDGQISSLKVVFDPRPVPAVKAA